MSEILKIYIEVGYSLNEIKEILTTTEMEYGIQLNALLSSATRTLLQETELKELQEKKAENRKVLNELIKMMQQDSQKEAKEKKEKREQDIEMHKNKLIHELQEQKASLVDSMLSRKSIIQEIVSKVIGINIEENSHIGTINFLKESSSMYQEKRRIEMVEIQRKISSIYFALQSTVPNINLKKVEQETEIPLPYATEEDVKKQYRIIATKILDISTAIEQGKGNKKDLEEIISILSEIVTKDLSHSLSEYQAFAKLKAEVDAELQSYAQSSQEQQEKQPLTKEQQFKADVKAILEKYYESIIENTELDVALLSIEEIARRKAERNEQIKIYSENLDTARYNELAYPNVNRITLLEEVKKEISYLYETKYQSVLASLPVRKLFQETYFTIRRLASELITSETQGMSSQTYTQKFIEFQNKILQLQTSLEKSGIIIHSKNQEVEMQLTYKKGEQEEKITSPTIYTISEEERNKRKETHTQQEVKDTIQVTVKELNFGPQSQKINRIINLLTSLDGIKMSILQDAIKIKYKQTLVDELKKLQAKIDIVATSVNNGSIEIDTQQDKETDTIEKNIRKPKDIKEVKINIVDEINKNILANHIILDEDIKRALAESHPEEEKRMGK